MHTREYASGVLALLSDHTVATQAVIVSAMLDAVTHRPQPHLTAMSAGAWEGGGFGGGGGGAVGPEVLTWSHRAFGYCGGRHGEQRFIVEVGLHAAPALDLQPVAAAVGLAPSTNPDAIRYRVDAGFGANATGVIADGGPMLDRFRRLAGLGEPLGATAQSGWGLRWLRNHWAMKPRESYFGALFGEKPPVNHDVIETDLLTWTFAGGDATTQFVARPVRPATSDTPPFKPTVDAASKFADRVRAKLVSSPVNSEALLRRLSLGQ